MHVWDEIADWVKQTRRQVDIYVTEVGITITNAEGEDVFEGWPAGHAAIMETGDTLEEAWEAFKSKLAAF
jgi:CTP synthase (UTP-ammonia lyase)